MTSGDGTIVISPEGRCCMKRQTDSIRRPEIQGRPSTSAQRRALPLAPTRRELCRLLVLTLVWMVVLPGPARALQSESWVEPPDSAAVGLGHAASLPANLTRERESAATAVAHVAMVPQLADNLALLYEKFGEDEFVVCIEGEFGDAEQLQLRDFRMPHHAYSNSTSAGIYPAGDCRQYKGIIGTLHNHPQTLPQDRGGERDNCYLSRTDIVSWLEHSAYQYTLVMCGSRLWAWWHRSQIDPTADLFFPPPGQLLGPPSTDPRASP